MNIKENNILPVQRMKGGTDLRATQAEARGPRLQEQPPGGKGRVLRFTLMSRIIIVAVVRLTVVK